MIPARTIRSVGEFGFLDRLLPTLARGPGVLVGAGDDCAVVRGARTGVLVTTDALVEGVHFRRGWLSAAQIGRKAYLVNASDVAAMGGRPRFCVVSVGVPEDSAVADLAALHRGLMAAARGTGALVVGGNLTRSERLFVSVTLLGDAPRRPLLRSGARAGDLLYVTGTLGEAALGLRLLHRDATARGAAVRRFREPVPRLRAGALLARPGHASAAVDLSDGLMQDLGHLCAASRVGAVVEKRLVPVTAGVRRAGVELALAGGEDYELLCAVPVRNRARVERIAAGFGCAFTRIGRCLPAAEGIWLVDEAGRDRRVHRAGFDHFARGADDEPGTPA